jgi:hypothetical protein
MTFGSVRDDLRAAESAWTISSGVSFGTYRPCQTPTSRFGRPASEVVGTSGRASFRSGLVMAYAFTVPALICSVVFVVWSHMKSTWLPTRSSMAGPVPSYGTSVSFVSIAAMNSNPHRCEAAPMPALAYVTVAWLALT